MIGGGARRIGSRALLDDERLLGWLRTEHRTSRFTSVCTGSLLLAAAGLLEGLSATTHWGSLDRQGELGAVATQQRVVEHLDQRIITAAGVFSGIGMALRLGELLTGQITAEVMPLMIEYDPQPPFDTGSLTKAAPQVVAKARGLALAPGAGSGAAGRHDGAESPGRRARLKPGRRPGGADGRLAVGGGGRGDQGGDQMSHLMGGVRPRAVSSIRAADLPRCLQDHDLLIRTH